MAASAVYITLGSHSMSSLSTTCQQCGRSLSNDAVECSFCPTTKAKPDHEPSPALNPPLSTASKVMRAILGGPLIFVGFGLMTTAGTFSILPALLLFGVALGIFFLRGVAFFFFVVVGPMLLLLLFMALSAIGTRG